MVRLGTSTNLSVDGSGPVMARNDQSPANTEGRPTDGRRSHRRRAGQRTCGVGAVLVVLAAAVTGCGSNATTTTTSSSASTSPASSSSTSASRSSSVSSSTSSASAATSTGSAASVTSGSTSYPAGKEQICQARDQLRASITALTDQGLLAAGTTAIKASVDQVQTDLEAVKEAGKQDYQAQVTNLQEALQQLQTAVGNLGNGDTAENLRAVSKAITLTGAAGEDLLTQLKTACG